MIQNLSKRPSQSAAAAADTGGRAAFIAALSAGAKVAAAARAGGHRTWAWYALRTADVGFDAAWTAATGRSRRVLKPQNWRPQTRRAFLAALAAGGDPAAAATAVEREPASAYRLKAGNADFAKAWELASERAIGAVRAKLVAALLAAPPDKLDVKAALAVIGWRAEPRQHGPAASIVPDARASAKEAKARAEILARLKAVTGSTA